SGSPAWACWASSSTRVCLSERLSTTTRCRSRPDPRWRGRHSVGLGDEVHQTLDRPEQGGLDIAVGADGGEHAPEAVGGLAPAEPVADAGLPVLAPRDHRPFADADGGRLDRLPDVDIRVPRDQD